MSAPLALEHQAALDQLGRALAAALASAAERTAIDSADDCRPPVAGVQTTQHEATPSPAKSRRRFEEDDRSEHTSTAD